jgi:hypothetical protein
VRAAPNPAAAARAHRRRLAAHSALAASSRNRDSLYGARKKKEVGKRQSRSTVVRATLSDTSTRVSG